MRVCRNSGGACSKDGCLKEHKDESLSDFKKEEALHRFLS